MQHRQGNRYFVIVLAPWFILHRCREQALKTERTVTKFRVLFHPLLPVPETSILVFVLSTHFPHTSLGRRMTWTGKVFSSFFQGWLSRDRRKKSPSSSASSKASRHIVRLGCDLVVTGSAGGLGAQCFSCIKPLLTLSWSDHSSLFWLLRSPSHLLQDGDDLFEAGPLAGVLVHADADELGHVGGDAGRDLDPEALVGDLEGREMVLLWKRLWE